MTGEPLDQAALAEELASTVRDGAEAGEAVSLARRLVADWAHEADPMPDPAAVARYQREDLEAAAAQLGGDRLRALELELLRRRLNELDAATSRLAQETLDGKVSSEEAKRRGQALLEECKEVASSLDGFGPNQITDAMRRSLGEAMLDALYAVERKAMSPRLARANAPADSQTDAGEGPPEMRAP